MSNITKFVAALLILLITILFASRQLFLFVIPGGRSHLWFAAIALFTACAAGALMSYFLSRHEKNKWSKVQMTPTAPLAIVSTLGPFDALKAAKLAATRWALANTWLVEGDADDRRPMDGAVADNSPAASEQRSFARRTHQSMFKKWSQARHD